MLLPSEIIICILTINKSPILTRHLRELSRQFKQCCINPLTDITLISDSCLCYQLRYHYKYIIARASVLYIDIAVKYNCIDNMKWFHSIRHSCADHTFETAVIHSNPSMLQALCDRVRFDTFNHKNIMKIAEKNGKYDNMKWLKTHGFDFHWDSGF